MNSQLPDAQLRKLQRLVASPKLPERPLRSKPETGPAAVLGNYTLHTPLGPRTWEATHPQHPGRLVVRLLAKEPKPDLVPKALAELKAIAKITSPIVVPNMRIARTGSLHFLVREYIAGPNLIMWGGPPRTGILAFYQLARALESAHAQGLIHGDLSPHNVVMDDAGRPYMLDFGLRRIGLALAGQGANRPDAAVDSTDLGTLFLTLVTGKPPADFLNSSIPAPLPSIDPSVDSMVRTLAMRVLSDAYPTARDLANSASHICQRLPTSDTGRIDLMERFKRKSEASPSENRQGPAS